MAAFDDYAERYENIRMQRRDGILEITLHTNGDTLQWGLDIHRDLPQAFKDIGGDRDNHIVIITGAGEGFIGPRAAAGARLKMAPGDWDRIYWEGKQLLMNLLDIEVPMIGAINGPAVRHSEIPLLCDIVLAAEEASFQDSAHFMNGVVPGDGVHVVYPLLLGLNRGRYFLLTGQTLDAAEAKTLGLVNEVLPRAELLPRAWALAEQILRQPPLVRRYSRVLFAQHIKRLLHDLLGYGLALEGLGAADNLLAEQ